MYKDKDIEAISRIVLPLCKTCHLTTLAEPRGEVAGHMLRRLSGKPTESTETYGNIKKAFKGARKEASTEDLILVFGSFPVVSGVLQLFNRTA
jgi:folylpolyglutamate synthase/dihydropteroate synthase